MTIATWADPTGVVTSGGFMKAKVVQNALVNNESLAMVCLARKTVTESVNSNTTPQNDDDLFFSIAAAELWYLRFVFRVSAGGAVDVDIKIQFDAPVGTSLNIEGGGLNSAGSLAIQRWPDTTTTQTYNVTTTTATAWVASGLVYTTSAGGTFRVKWAQGNSSATATNMLLGSCIMGTKIGSNPRLAV